MASRPRSTSKSARLDDVIALASLRACAVLPCHNGLHRIARNGSQLLDRQGRADRIDPAGRDEPRTDHRAVALVDKWNADIERRKDSQYGYADRARLPEFSPHIGAAILAKKSWLRLLCPVCQHHACSVESHQTTPAVAVEPAVATETVRC